MNMKYSVTPMATQLIICVDIFQGQYALFHEDLVKTYGDIVGSVSV